MQVIRGCGHIQDRHGVGLAHKDASGLLGLPVEIPQSWDLAKYVDKVRDQGDSGSCVGQALTSAAYIWATSRDITSFEHPSALAAYTMARAGSRTTSREALEDKGSMPAVAAQMLQKWGFVPEHQYPFDLSLINSELPIDCLMTASGHKLENYYKILSDGQQRILDIKIALSKNYPVCIAIVVDSGFDNTNGKDYLGIPFGTYRGSHYICIVGYDTKGVKVLNSWSNEWGDGGFAWLSYDRIMDDSTRDLVCVSLTEV